MAPSKVAPRAMEGPGQVLLVNRGPSLSSIAVTSSRVHALLRHFQESYYRHSSWATRQTLLVTVHLCSTLYIFISVPLRVAFYYNPNISTSQWTQELNVFVFTDIVVDLVGLVQFLTFFRRWRAFQFSSQSEAGNDSSVRLGSQAKASKNGPRRSSSFVAQRPQGKIKWTISTILSSTAIQKVTETVHSSSKKQMRELVLEVVAVAPVEIIPVALNAFNALHLVRITKLCRLYRLRNCFVRIMTIYSDRTWAQHLSSTGVDTLVRKIGLCAGLCHWTACGYMILAHAQCGVDLEACRGEEETSWVVRDRLFGASVPRKYARALYWAARTLVLLGYNDVTPVSSAETLYAVVVTLMGALFGTSMLANFLFLFRLRNARYAAFATHVDNAREYMRSQNIPRPLRHQVSAYYSYSWSAHRSLDSEEALHFMPTHLQSKVVSTLKASRVKQVCFLAKESVEFTNMLALALVRRVYSPSDLIIEPKINAETFFVIRGKVVLSAFNGTNVKDYGAGDFFADSCLLYPEQYDQKAVAKTFCELYVLAKSKFDEAISEFYRGNEADVRFRMADILDKYVMQLQKMKKLLGLQGAHDNTSRKSAIGGSTYNLAIEENNKPETRRNMDWRLPGS